MAASASSILPGRRATGIRAENSGSSTSVDRRAMLGCLALSPLVGLPLVPTDLGRSAPGPSATGSRKMQNSASNRTRWRAVVEKLETAKRAQAEAFEALGPVEERFHSGKPVDLVPDISTWDFTQAGWEARERTRAEWQASVSKWRVESGLTAAEDRTSAAGAAICDALQALIDTPAPDLDAIAEKLRLASEDEFDLAELVEPLSADLRRLAVAS